VVIFTVIGFLAAAFGLSVGKRSRASGSDMLALLIGACFYGALGVLFYFAAKSTMRSRRWAPLTMFILNALLLAVFVIGTLLAVTLGGADATALIPGIIGSIFPAAFAIVSWKAFTAIPKYLVQPAWCQELLVTANL